MKSHKEILSEHYGCKSFNELKKYLDGISVSMILEVMDIAAKQAYDEGSINGGFAVGGVRESISPETYLNRINNG